MKKLFTIIIALMILATFARAEDGDFGSSGDYTADTTANSYEPQPDISYDTRDNETRVEPSRNEDARSETHYSEPARETGGYSNGYSSGHTGSSQSSGTSIVDVYVQYRLIKWLFDDPPKSTATATTSNARHRPSAPQPQQPDPRVQILREMKNASMPLTETLSNKLTDVSVSKATLIFNGYHTDSFTKRDREIALESLLKLVALNPAYSTLEGPIASILFPVTQETHKALTVNTNLLLTLQKLGLNTQDENKIKSYQTNYRAATSQFLLALSLYGQAQRENLTVSEASQEAMRASFYALAYELNKMKVSEDVRAKLAAGFIAQVGEVAPEMINRMSSLFASQTHLEALRTGLYKNIATTEEDIKSSQRKSRAAAVAAGAAVLAAWMAGGSSAVDVLTSHVGVQNLTLAAATVTLPIVGYIATKMGIKKLQGASTHPVFGATENIFTKPLNERSNLTNACKTFYGR